MNVLLDGTAISTERELHEALAAQLEFGDFYGWNLAALRDRLMTDVPRPVRVIWENADASRSRLGDDVFGRICSVFEEAQAQDLEFGWTERFSFEIR